MTIFYKVVVIHWVLFIPCATHFGSLFIVLLIFLFFHSCDNPSCLHLLFCTSQTSPCLHCPILHLISLLVWHLSWQLFPHIDQWPMSLPIVFQLSAPNFIMDHKRCWFTDWLSTCLLHICGCVFVLVYNFLKNDCPLLFLLDSHQNLNWHARVLPSHEYRCKPKTPVVLPYTRV